MDQPVDESGTGSTGVEHAPGERPDITRLARTLRRRDEIGTLALVILALLAVLYTFYFARAVILPVVLAALFNFVLKPVVRALKRLHVPEPLGAATVLIVFVGLIVLGLINLAEPASRWIAQAPDRIRQLERRFQPLLEPAREISHAANGASASQPNQSDQVNVKVQQKSMSGVLLGFTKSFLLGALETAVLLFFFLAAGDHFIRKLTLVLPTFGGRKQAVEMAHEIQARVSRYLATISAINVAEGTLVALVMSFLKMPNPILWGVMACLLNFIPYLGALCMGTILALVGLSTFDHIGRALLPVLAYAVINLFEGNLITPMIVGRRLTLNPAVVFVSLMGGALIWGIPGMLVAVPILMVAKIVCDHVKPLAAIGEFLTR